MLALEVLLQVACCQCGESMTATVRCEGDGLRDEQPRSLVHLRCPECERVNHVVFAPDSGEVLHVLDELRILRMPEPSFN